MKKPVVSPICIPEPLYEVRRTTANRHRQGQMSPYVNQILNYGEIKLPTLLEGDNFSQFPPAHEVFRPLRQNVYAILFNLHHARFTKKNIENTAKKEANELIKKAKQQNEREGDKLKAKAEKLLKQDFSANYIVHEWHPYNGYESPCAVAPQELQWAVPTVQRLWFGSTVDDKQKRLHAFMSILRCDTAADSLLLHSNVPQPMLIMACVLRYIITANLANPIIRKPELDAFLVTAYSPELRNDAFLDELSLDSVTTRGVRLGVLFMQVTCLLPNRHSLVRDWMNFLIIQIL